MQGIHVINDPNGNPAVLTIDLHNLDPNVSPLVTRLLELLQNQTEELERREFLEASGTLVDRTYSDEPEYTDGHLIERNSNYRPK